MTRRSMILQAGVAMMKAALAAMNEQGAVLRTLMEESNRSAGRVYGPRVTATKNVGKDWLKPVRRSRYKPHQGHRERSRRLSQLDRDIDPTPHRWTGLPRANANPGRSFAANGGLR